MKTAMGQTPGLGASVHVSNSLAGIGFDPSISLNLGNTVDGNIRIEIDWAIVDLHIFT